MVNRAESCGSKAITSIRLLLPPAVSPIKFLFTKRDKPGSGLLLYRKIHQRILASHVACYPVSCNSESGRDTGPFAHLVLFKCERQVRCREAQIQLLVVAKPEL